MKKFIYIAYVVVLVISFVMYPATTRAAALGKVFISEVQTGGFTSQKTEESMQEFIELYNPGAVAVNLKDWRLEYLSAAHTGGSEPTRIVATMVGSLEPQSFITVGSVAQAAAAFNTSTNGQLPRTGGHIRLVNASGELIDLVGWGNATKIDNWWSAPEIPAGQSIERILPGDADFDNGIAYRAPNEPTPTNGSRRLPEPAKDRCEGLELSEILPNPIGPDSGKEFIEVYNPTSNPIALQGCAVGFADNTARYSLPNELLAPGAYRAFYDTDTKFTLPNASGQSVNLYRSGETLSTVYPGSLDEDVAWAFVDGAWRTTSVPTPNAPNMVASKSTPDTPPTSTAATACPEGKIRNPQTGRCRADAQSSTPNTCKAGQIRNPETNRCKTIAATAIVQPCATNQVRNPETNRCRAVQSATTTAKSCPLGQERNQQTNRCRKVTDATSQHFATVKDVQSAGVGYQWWIGGGVIALALGYAGYEWRHDLRNALHTAQLKRVIRKQK